MIKVLRVITRLNVGGPAQNVAYLTAGMRPLGFETTLVSGRLQDQEGDMGYFCEQRGVEVRYVDALVRPLSPLRDIAALLALIRILWAERPDILHTHLAKAGFLARQAAVLLRPFGVRPKIIHTYHGHVFHSYFSNRENRLFVFLERLCGRWSDRLIPVSDRLKQELAETYRIAPADKFKVIHLGFDLAPFAGRPRRSGSFRKSIEVDLKTPLAGIVGRLTGVKDHRLFLESFKTLLVSKPGARAVIVGDGESRERVEQDVRELGLECNVIWTGFRRDLADIYSDLDVLALTSLNEGTPVAVIEALAAGCPIVAAAVGGVPDVMMLGEPRAIPPGENITATPGGFLVASRNPADYAGCCARILNGEFTPDPAARARVTSLYSAERLCRDMAELYNQLL